MPIDPSIIFRLDNKPAFDSSKIVNLIAQNQQRRMQQETHAQQTQLHNQQMEQNALAIKEHNRTASEGEQYRALFAPAPGANGQPAAPDIKSIIPKAFAINPTLGMALQTSVHKQEKDALDAQKTQLETDFEKAKQWGAVAGTMTDEPSFLRGAQDALGRHLIDTNGYQELIQQGWNPQTQSQIQQIRQSAMTAPEQHTAMLADNEEERKKLDAQHKRELEPFQQQKAVADATLATATAAGQAPIQPADQARMDEQRASGEAQRALTRRGQDMTDSRSRELAQIARDGAAAVRENKPPTSAQTTVATYAERLHQSNPILESAQQAFGERTWNSIAPNWAKTEKGQQFEQAEKNYINSVLRRESGAVIADSEFKNARAQYIPQPGDSPAVLTQKRNNRLLVQESFKKAAGKAYEDPDELIRKAGGSPAPGKTQSFKSDGITYNIPDSEVAEFLGTHKDAQKAKAK